MDTDMGLQNEMAESFKETLRMAGGQIRKTLCDMRRPHVLMRPKVYWFGNKWHCLLGDNTHDGIYGSGKTPKEACGNFDDVWWNGKKAPKTKEGA